MNHTLSPFHLAIPVDDLQKARKFYNDIFELEEGRSSNHWVDFNFFGHQLVIHYKPKSEEKKKRIAIGLMVKTFLYPILGSF